MEKAKVPAPCNQEIYKDGKTVAIYSAGMIAMEGLVKEANRNLYNCDQMDWHYAGGRAVVLTLGDIEKCKKALRDAIPQQLQ